jgi:hypothetical protein
MIEQSRQRICSPFRLLILVGGGLLLAPHAALAQTCIQDVWKAHGNNQNLTCTAQDVTLSKATNIDIISGGEDIVVNGQTLHRCFAGQTVTFTADFEMDLTADTRYDVAFYIATDSDPNHDGAKTGQCSATASLSSNTAAGNFINLDAAPDVCGDITGPLGTVHNALFVKSQISAQCPNLAGQQLSLPFCTTWRQPGSNQTCLGTGNGTTTNDAYPGSPSKCNCGTLAIDIFSADTTIEVTKTALTSSVPETGGTASYSVTVNNKSAVAVTLRSLVDDKYGDLFTIQGSTCVADGDPATCEKDGVIAANGSCSCTFPGLVPPGDTGGTFKDEVEACADNNTNPTLKCAKDDAEVPYTDVPQPPTLTKAVSGTQCTIDVTYNVSVTNTSAQDTLRLDSLVDDVYGNIADATNTLIKSTTCGQASGAGALPYVIPAASGYTCSFVAAITSCDTTVTDTVTGNATDDDGANYTPSDHATVVVTPPSTPPY